MEIVFLIALSVIFAIRAIHSTRLVTSALWLAGVSVFVSIILFLFGAELAAVIELSVGAGLVTVLFVFAIAIAGEEVILMKPLVSTWLAGTIIVLLIGLLTWFIVIPDVGEISLVEEPLVMDVLWQERGLDVLIQIVVIYSGALGILGLLAEAKAPLMYPIAAQISFQRNQELELLEEQSMEKEEI